MQNRPKIKNRRSLFLELLKLDKRKYPQILDFMAIRALLAELWKKANILTYSKNFDFFLKKPKYCLYSEKPKYKLNTIAPQLVILTITSRNTKCIKPMKYINDALKA